MTTTQHIIVDRKGINNLTPIGSLQNKPSHGPKNKMHNVCKKSDSIC